MKERGMIFNGEMVRALLDGRKTQTRRIVKGTDSAVKFCKEWNINGEEVFVVLGEKDHTGMNPVLGAISCPFGAVGNRIWVREAFRVHSRATDVATLVYKASERNSWTEQTHRVPVAVCNKPATPEKWTPSLHMPRWASRILLEITDVRVERLNAISEEDAEAEGINMEALADSQDRYDCIADHNMTGRPTATGAFKYLWESIYGEESWKANSWVWVISFKRVEGGAA
ncbi:TPA: hypothetical protein NBM61_000063 [Klebsiella pneumoniae]|uniref:hypothetical protein n=1 Tax=Klebsiella pneumoniae TaxID=573 RepID=UPI001C532C6F|nr:hypothetical protein [Klebsiella pneumoniae]HBQ5923834.1 hypothetical protein [Klebsiella pneumoniae subsp. pneumoniae]EKW7157947.1 hypothetical protein [Klebsiella pneumoniae]MCQ0738637.1 hypothetical protein [Klebsiella pneumoniae]HCD3075399.1 hypothetical protein [Klebsiella pneumoniae]HCD3214762.1 hypothetical protein [Klebsiella pneumoniae]